MSRMQQLPGFMRVFVALAAVALLGGGPAGARAETAPIYSQMDRLHPVYAANGMVASQEALATQIGVDILKRGGNAVDAAVAVGFALAVTLPQAGNLGGGGFMLVHMAKTGETVAIDYREKAPLAATRDMFLDANGKRRPEALAMERAQRRRARHRRRARPRAAALRHDGPRTK